MPTRIKTFPCGHKGRGQYCHRCQQEQQHQQEQHQQRETERETQRAWAASFAGDAVDLRAIRHRPDLVATARALLAAVAGGSHPLTLGGQQINADHSLFSVPVGYDYRLLFRATSTGMVAEKFLSHEDYNKYLK